MVSTEPRSLSKQQILLSLVLALCVVPLPISLSVINPMLSMNDCDTMKLVSSSTESSDTATD